jgi:hypothetical protein
MISIIHRGHVELRDAELGATLTLEPGRVELDIASTDQAHTMPERIEMIRFRSNTGYFTLTDLLRLNHRMRLGLAGLSTYSASLAFESAHFQTKEEIKSPTWSMIVGDVAKIIHVNGVIQHIIMSETGGMIINYTIASPPPVVVECVSAGLILRFGQHIRSGGNPINGPTLTLTYPIDLVFPEDVSIDVALRSMHRVREALSLMMGRLLPITSASIKMPGEANPHEVAIHGLLSTEPAEKPAEHILTTVTPDILATVIDCWLTRYDELGDAIRLHMSGLEQRQIPTELRFQIFVQALEALHRRTAPPAANAIDLATILETLRERGIPNDVVDRVNGVLAHAHEPGLRQRLRHYCNQFEAEISTLRPAERRKTFISRVAATRNHFAHRTDLDDQVLDGSDLWDVTETVKAISHMALLREVGADTAGIGQTMLGRRFVEYVLRE